MTVKELIEKLKEIPQDREVSLVIDYERNKTMDICDDSVTVPVPVPVPVCIFYTKDQ